MPQNMPLPTKAKMTALVCSGRIRPKVVKGVFRFSSGQKNWQAASSPASVPTRPQMAVAMANARTMWLSYLNVSSSAAAARPAGTGRCCVSRLCAHVVVVGFGSGSVGLLAGCRGSSSVSIRIEG